jgi:DNA gyrase subunit B
VSPVDIDNTYNAAHLLVLEGLEAVRKRPGMYIGSTDTRGLMHCLWEIIDNGVDEALAGARAPVEVTLHPDGSVEVHDDGRGIPVDKEPRPGCPASRWSSPSCTPAASSAAARTSPPVACTASARRWSTRCPPGSTSTSTATPSQQGMSVPPRRPRRLRRRRADRGVHARSGLTRKGGGSPRPGPAPGSASGRTGRSSPRTPTSSTTSCSPRPPDVVHRARPRAGHPRPARPRPAVEEKFRHDGGITEFAEFLAPDDEPVTDVLRLQGTDTFTETVPVLDDKGHMTPQEVERELEVDVAVRWGTGYDTELRSFVNVIATPKGGTHVSGFERR